MFTDKRKKSKNLDTEQKNEKGERVSMQRYKKRKQGQFGFPVFQPILAGHRAALSIPENREPLSVIHIQSLLLGIIAGNLNQPHVEKWFLLRKWIQVSQTVVLVIDDLSVNDIEKHKEEFSESIKIFDYGFEVNNPKNEGLSIAQILAFSPVTNVVKHNIASVYHSLQEALEDGHIFSIVDSIKETCQQYKANTQETTKENEKNKGCCKLDLVLSAVQLFTAEYELPEKNNDSRFVYTKDKYEPVAENSPMFSLDCEWSLCTDGSLFVARVAIVDEKLNPVYHTFIKNEKDTVRKLAQKWNVNFEVHKDSQKSLAVVQEDIRKLLPPDAILVGHGLFKDLSALQLFHPYVIDTSIIYNLSGCRAVKTKLQFLSAAFINRDIQSLYLPAHDPTEDAASSMELVLLKLKKGLEYGDVRFGSNGNWEGPAVEKLLKVISGTIYGGTYQKKKILGEEFDFGGCLKMKFFTFAQTQMKSTALITLPQHEMYYRPKLPAPPKLFACHTNPVQVRVEKKFQDAIETLYTQMDKNFVLVHTEVNELTQEKQSNLKVLDKVICDIYNKMAPNGMLVVYFGGKCLEENGVCMLRLKTPQIN